jgi:hypothetical protein
MKEGGKRKLLKKLKPENEGRDFRLSRRRV